MSVAANEANETVVTLMHQCLFKSRILSNKEMGKVKAKLQTPEDRDGLISVLNDVGIHPRQVMKNECFEHRIWKSSFVWRDCITYTINSKLD
jgi:hypothetical protein